MKMIEINNDDIRVISYQAYRAKERNKTVSVDPDELITLCSLASRMLEIEKMNERGNW